MTGRFSNFNSISYTEDRHELQVTGTKCRLPDMMSGTGEIFISGAAALIIVQANRSNFLNFELSYTGSFIWAVVTFALATISL